MHAFTTKNVPKHGSTISWVPLLILATRCFIQVTLYSSRPTALFPRLTPARHHNRLVSPHLVPLSHEICRFADASSGSPRSSGSPNDPTLHRMTHPSLGRHRGLAHDRMLCLPHAPILLVHFRSPSVLKRY